MLCVLEGVSERSGSLRVDNATGLKMATMSYTQFIKYLVAKAPKGGSRRRSSRLRARTSSYTAYRKVRAAIARRSLSIIRNTPKRAYRLHRTIPLSLQLRLRARVLLEHRDHRAARRRLSLHLAHVAERLRELHRRL